MSTNSYSLGNTSLPPPTSSFFSLDYTVLYQNYQCLNLLATSFRNISIIVICLLLLLPLNILVLYLVLRRLCRHSTGATMTHSDVFTFHVSIMELIKILGNVFIGYGLSSYISNPVTIGTTLSSLNIFGSTLFQTLTCVEHYVAVVHPITYLGLKNAQGIRWRNISIGLTWCLSFAGSSTLFLTVRICLFFMLSLLAFICYINFFCCVSVLCVLIRPGPADRIGGGRRVDQSRLKAFHTILAILSLLLVKFGGTLIVCALTITQTLQMSSNCHLWLSLYWFYLPSDLVLPMLFLHRAGVLSHC